MTASMQEIIDHNSGAASFKYMMLDRLRSDCEYFLGYGNRCERQLWSGSVEEHIADMKALWHSFPDDAKPEWLTMAQIEAYEQAMLKKD